MTQKEEEIQKIISFIQQNPHSYASIAVCRRAVDSGISTVTNSVIEELKRQLIEADENEIEAYYTIVM